MRVLPTKRSLLAARLAALVIALVGLTAPAAAQAKTFCVATTAADCQQGGYSANGAGLQTALTDSHNYVDISGPNTVRVGPGIYERPGGFAVMNPMRVIGSGPATVLGATDAQLPIQSTTISGASLSALTVRVATSASGPTGFSEVTDVRVTGSGTPSFGLQLRPGGRASRVVVDPAGIGLIGISLQDGATIENSSVVVRGGSSSAIAVGSQSAGAPAVVRHVTVLGIATGAAASGISVTGSRNPTTTAYARGVVRDSVVRGFATSLRRRVADSSTPCTGCGTASADLAVSYSSFAAAAVASAAGDPGTLTLGPGNLDDPDPLFTDVGLGNLRLRAGSPLIDRGDPAGIQSGESSVDLNEGPRVIGPRSDIGALESPLPLPLPSLSPTSGADVVAPVLSKAALTRRRFRVARAATPILATTGAQRKKRPASGTTLGYTLSERATVTLKLERKLRGRRIANRGKRPRCLIETRSNRKRPNKRCAVYKKAGTLTRSGTAGRQRVKLSGRVGSRRLKPGTYRLTASARDVAGNTGKRRTLAFTVVK